MYKPWFKKRMPSSLADWFLRRELGKNLNERVEWELRCLEDGRRFREQRRLAKKAEKLFLRVPPFTAADSEYWYRSTNTGIWLWTDETINQVRQSIRIEMTTRRDYALRWVTPFVGIIGVMVGFLLSELARYTMRR